MSDLRFGKAFGTGDSWSEFCKKEEEERKKRQSIDDSEAIRKVRKQLLKKVSGGASSLTGIQAEADQEAKEEQAGKEESSAQDAGDPPELVAAMPTIRVMAEEIRRSTSHSYVSDDWIALVEKTDKAKAETITPETAADIVEFVENVQIELLDYVVAIQDRLYPGHE